MTELEPIDPETAVTLYLDQRRNEVSESRRLLHAEEAREWRESIKAGRTATPAQIYFRNSEHNDLS